MRNKLLMCVLGLALLTISATPQQDVLRLEQRVNQMETRLYTIESNLRTVEQQTRLGGASQRGLSQEDVARLRAEIQTLQLRLQEDECALARLDERTLSPAMRRRPAEEPTPAARTSMRPCIYPTASSATKRN